MTQISMAAANPANISKMAATQRNLKTLSLNVVLLQSGPHYINIPFHSFSVGAALGILWQVVKF